MKCGTIPHKKYVTFFLSNRIHSDSVPFYLRKICTVPFCRIFPVVFAFKWNVLLSSRLFPLLLLVMTSFSFSPFQAKDLAKQYTGIEDVNTAVSEFRKILQSRSMFFNDAGFPANESGDEAFMKCVDAEGAGAFCPVRWRSLQKWINYTKEVS